MEGKMKCPICGKENKRIYYSEDIGLAEDYYSCDNCGYNLEMCYSPTHEWIDLDKWNINKLKELWDSQSINTKPVRHGQWISFLDGDHIMPERYYRCSRCGRVESSRQPYCHCGAIMDLEG